MAKEIQRHIERLITNRLGYEPTRRFKTSEIETDLDLQVHLITLDFKTLNWFSEREQLAERAYRCKQLGALQKQMPSEQRVNYLTTPERIQAWIEVYEESDKFKKDQ